MQLVLSGMCCHLSWQHLDSQGNGQRCTSESVCPGRQCSRPRQPQYDGGNLGRGSQEFHHYFFTLAPDDKYIKYTMEKAMYLIDETGLAQYNALKEKGFYGNIMGTSAVFSIFCDSIRFSEENMSFTYYGRQRIERRTSVLMRELVTEGYLKRVPRTENNPHGLLIVNWRTILNKDLEQRTKSNY